MAGSAPASLPTSSPQCPRCGASVTAGTKFCPQCGAPLTAPSVTAAPSGPSTPGGIDIRERVDQDRGALKRLQLLIPGFRAYRQGEDVRAADAILRLQVADLLVQAMQRVDSLRQRMSRDGVITGLTTIGGLRSELQRLEGEIRHAEQGYTGLSPALRITPETLDRLYERDYQFIASGQGVLSAIAPVEAAVSSGVPASINSTVDALRSRLKDLENTFAQRVQNVELVLKS